MRPLAVYIHIPFCAKKCAYCDFASYAGCESRFDAYFDALWAEMDSWESGLSNRTVRSVFFGGGTPSLVPAGKIVQTVERLRVIAGFDPDAEISIEANPGTLTPEKLDSYREAGFNRISIGVQSFDADELRLLGRIHTPRQAEEAIRMARQAGFENINLDLMYALPGQSMENWLRTLETAAQLPVTHISAYSLIVEPGTEMERRVQAGEAALPDDDTVNEMQRRCVRTLAAAGFERYEISNYAKKGFECRHNLTYWRCGEYLGLGCAAHSLFDGARFHNPPELERYLSGERKLDFAVQTAEDRMEERVMLETRTTRGLDLRAWKRDFGLDFKAGNLKRLKDYGLIEADHDFLRLTTAGLEVQDAVVLELLESGYGG